MRLVVGLLALTLTGSLAYAEDSKAPEPQVESPRAKVSLRVVSMLPESHQALLFDKHRGTHVLAAVGSTIEGYRVDAIEDDTVTLLGEGQRVVLAAPDSRWRRRGADRETPRPRPVPAVVAPVDPYATPAPEGPADPYAGDELPAAAATEGPVDPYAEAVRVVDAPRPIVAGEGGVRVAEAPGTETAVATTEPAPPAPAAPVPTAVPKTSPTPAPATQPLPSEAAEAMAALLPPPPPEDPAATPAPAAATTPSPAPAPTAGTPSVVLSRQDVATALADFGQLTSSVRGAFTAEGARVDMVAPRSVFAKLGLRSGDVVTSVDGAPLRSIDDAADLYIRASSLRTSTIQVIRNGKPIALHLAIQ